MKGRHPNPRPSLQRFVGYRPTGGDREIALSDRLSTFLLPGHSDRRLILRPLGARFGESRERLSQFRQLTAQMTLITVTGWSGASPPWAWRAPQGQ
jgi:hypothetical protein